MKVLVKSLNEIEKVGREIRNGKFSDEMLDLCGRLIEIKKDDKYGYICDFRGTGLVSGYGFQKEWLHILPEGYEYEKFESFEEACNWIADGGKIFTSKSGRILEIKAITLGVFKKEYATKYLKATKIEPKRITVRSWVNVYPTRISTRHKSKERADDCASPRRIDCKEIKLEYIQKPDGTWEEVE